MEERKLIEKKERKKNSSTLILNTSPSHCAAFKGNIDCLKCLVKSNADIWIKSKRGDYPIHEAVHAASFSKLQHQTNELPQVQINCFDIVRYIFELYPTKINIRNSEQRTSLHLAASLGNIEMCQVLIQYGARINSFIQTSAVNYSLIGILLLT